MKRFIALLLSLCLVVSMFAACDGTTQPLTTVPKQTDPTNEVPSYDTTETEPAETHVAKTEISESVLFESNGIKITVKDTVINDLNDPEIKLLVENTTDKNISLVGDTFIVNGIAMYGTLYIDVATGKKANGTLTLMQSDLETAGIEDIVTITSSDAYVLDSDSYYELFDVSFTINTSSDYQQAIDYSGDVVFEEGGIKVIAKTITNDFWGESIKLLVVNNSGSDFYAQADNVSVNGFTLTAWMSDLVPDGTVRYCDLGLFETDLEENDIEIIEDITFTFEAIDVDTYNCIIRSDEIQIFIAE